MAFIAAVAATVNGLNIMHSTMQGNDLALWESFVNYTIEYKKEYNSFANDHPLVEKRFKVSSIQHERYIH